MSDSVEFPTLEELDRDGAVHEAASKVDGHTRAAFMRRMGAFAGGGLLIGSLPVALASAQGVPASDIAILNFALTLEYLEAAFYNEAVSKGKLSGETATFAKTVAAHENAHVAALSKTLGSKAIKKPSFDFKGTTSDQATFQKTSIALEDTGVQAYLGQAGAIKAKPVLQAAASILPVEARHASWIADIIGGGSSPAPAPAAFQNSKTMSEVLSIVKSTGFLASSSAGGGPSNAQPASPTTGEPRMTG